MNSDTTESTLKYHVTSRHSIKTSAKMTITCLFIILARASPSGTEETCPRTSGSCCRVTAGRIVLRWTSHRENARITLVLVPRVHVTRGEGRLSIAGVWRVKTTSASRNHSQRGCCRRTAKQTKQLNYSGHKIWKKKKQRYKRGFWVRIKSSFTRSQQ